MSKAMWMDGYEEGRQEGYDLARAEQRTAFVVVALLSAVSGAIAASVAWAVVR